MLKQVLQLFYDTSVPPMKWMDVDLLTKCAVITRQGLHTVLAIHLIVRSIVGTLVIRQSTLVVKVKWAYVCVVMFQV